MTDSQGQTSGPGYFTKGVKRASFSVGPSEPLPVNVGVPVSEPVSSTVVAQPVVQQPATPQPVVAQPAVAAPPTAAPVQAPIQQAQPQPVVPITQQAPVSSPPVQTPVQAKKKKRSVGRVLFMILIILIVGGAVGGTFYLYWTSQLKLSMLEKAVPQVVDDYQNQTLIDRVRRHMDLPSETPKLITITNAASMRQQPFYAHAQDGDKVLVFSQRAILYDPVRDRIVEVGFIRPVAPTSVAQVTATNSAQPAVAGAQTSAPQPTPKILLKNDATK